MRMWYRDTYEFNARISCGKSGGRDGNAIVARKVCFQTEPFRHNLVTLTLPPEAREQRPNCLIQRISLHAHRRTPIPKTVRSIPVELKLRVAFCITNIAASMR